MLQLLPEVANVLYPRLQKRPHLLLRTGVLSLKGRQRLLGVFLKKMRSVHAARAVVSLHDGMLAKTDMAWCRNIRSPHCCRQVTA